MFCKATLFTVALALIASASPIVQESGTRVHIRKRSLKNVDGTVNREAVIRDKIRTHNKHRANLIKIDQNIGIENFHQGAHITDVMHLPEHLRKRQADSLTDQGDGDEWTGNIQIGTPANTFTIDFDTGSSDLWVASSSCDSCEAPATYDPSGSSTATMLSGTFSITYGDGSDASGPKYEDTVSVAGVTVTQQTLSAVTEESGDLVGGPAAGLMGMAWPANSNLDANPFFWTAIDQGAVSEGVFGFYLADNEGELYLGGTDSSLYSGNIEYHNLSSSGGFWQIGGASAIVNGETVLSDFETIIDTGTSLMYGPPDAVAQFYDSIDGAEEIENGTYAIPCNNFPTIEFSWGDKNFAISADAFNLGETENGMCQAALGGEDLGLGDNVWLFGDTFLLNVYAAFDVTHSTVGFADLA